MRKHDSAKQCIEKHIHFILFLGDYIHFSSLSCLNTFQVDVLKVDQSFIIKMNSGEASKQYVAAIIAIGHVMNFRVVAEGVEQAEQLEDLKEIDCDFIQGFLWWGKPMSPEDAAKLMEEEWNRQK